MIFEWNCWRSGTPHQNIYETTSLRLSVTGVNHTDTGSVLVFIRPLSIQPNSSFLSRLKIRYLLELLSSGSDLAAATPQKKKSPKIHNINSSSRVSDLLICCASRPGGTLSLPPLKCHVSAACWEVDVKRCRLQTAQLLNERTPLRRASACVRGAR